MIHLFSRWYKAIRQQHLQKVHTLKQDIDGQLYLIKNDEVQLIYYYLLNVRYYLLTDQLNEAEKVMNHLEKTYKPGRKAIDYYYYFFKGLLFSYRRNYAEAKKYYLTAESLLMYVDDELEKAEFHYSLANLYYYIRQSLLAVHYALKAKEVFVKHDDYQLKVAGCENILGLSYTTIKDFELAEEHFLLALDIVLKHKNKQLAILIRYNLGLMYADQPTLSKVAIRYLLEVYESGYQLHKSTYLLAREYFKIGETDIADRFLQEGLKVCQETENEEYLHHLTILNKFNHEANDDDLESAVKEGLAFFNNEGLFGFVQDYAEQLAAYYHEKGKYDKSSHYFYLAHEAKQKLLEKGALK
jgi:tetratricopeptide (TPR) repeat protein